MKLKTLAVVTICCLMYLGSYAQGNQVNLSEMDISKVYQHLGAPMRNSAVTDEPFSVAGQSYSNGIGVQAASQMKISLHNNALRFECEVGINDQSIEYDKSDITSIPLTDGTMVFYKTDGESKQFVGVGSGSGRIEKGGVVFKIIGDGKELYNSGVVKGGDVAKKVSLDVKGINILSLSVEDGDGNMSGDHANWLNAIIYYFEIAPSLVDADYQGEVKGMSSQIKSVLSKKISRLTKTTVELEAPKKDWLIDDSFAKTSVFQANDGKDIVLKNGLVSRIFRIFPNLATVDIQNLMTGENMLRAVSNEGIVTIDGRLYQLGGLDGQEEFGYTQYDWIDKMTPFANSFKVIDFEISEIEPRIKWANKRWSLAKKWDATGKKLTFILEGPDALKGVKVKLHYALYDGIPTISKWMEIENNTGISVNIDNFMLEQLAMAEPESPVEASSIHDFRKPNIHVESDWAFHGFIEKNADNTEYWSVDPRYTSQCNYPLMTPCLLEVKLPMGPDVLIENGESLESFRTWLMPFDSNDRERQGLFRRRMYRKIAPWTTENPIFMHCTSSDPEIVKQAVDQCVETGYEMIILSFGSGLNMENESAENIKKFNDLREYANKKGIELGGYSLLSSRWISDEVDVINPKTGKRGGMIFGSSPCLSSDWGKEYFRKIKNFYEKTGMTVFENDGSYPGNVCASTTHAHHKGLNDSQWEQRKLIANQYKWMCENGIYMNIPDYGYMLNGGSKVGIGYREVNWSLPRERQLVLGRQVLYDGLWDRSPGMCWTFVPLTQYHGGGAAATLEPLNEHLKDYKAHMMQNYGTGVQACYRGHRLYDTDKTKETVIEVIDWYKKYREILNSDIIHLRRADGKDWDGIMHASPKLKEKGFVMLYNPTDKELNRTIVLPLYYTGLTKSVEIREQEGASKNFKLDERQRVEIKVNIPAKGYTWLVIEDATSKK